MKKTEMKQMVIRISEDHWRLFEKKEKRYSGARRVVMEAVDVYLKERKSERLYPPDNGDYLYTTYPRKWFESVMRIARGLGFTTAKEFVNEALAFRAKGLEEKI